MRIGLGTAQLGLDYGATNKTGKPNQSLVPELLKAAQNGGFSVIDTASTYGNSESVLGKFLPKDWHPSIITKIPPLNGHDVNIVEKYLRRSIARLGRPITGVLVHHAEDLLRANGPEVLKVLSRMKASGLVSQIGFSAYTAEEIDTLLKIFQPDIVQLPSSVADQRLIKSGHIAELKKRGIQVHCRSALLQGLLLAEKKNICSYFNDLVPVLDLLEHWSKENNVSRLTICLAFLKQTQNINSLILGASTISEVNELSKAALKVETCPVFPWEEIPKLDAKILNPMNWPHRDLILNL